MVGCSCCLREDVKLEVGLLAGALGSLQGRKGSESMMCMKGCKVWGSRVCGIYRERENKSVKNQLPA